MHAFVEFMNISMEFVDPKEFQKRRELARTNQGHVTLVTHVPSGESFVLKSRYCAKSDSIPIREYSILRSLTHPNIIKCFGLLRELPLVSLVLQAADSDLSRELRRRKKLCIEFLDEEVWNWAKQGLDALTYLQSKGVVHRDVKPSNILLTKEGVLMLTDFGVSEAGTFDEDEQLKGTPLYLSPEVLEGRSASHKADIWAFGVVIYELLMQVVPFDGKTFVDLIHATLKGKYSPVTGNRSRKFRLMLQRMLVVDPFERFDACEIRDWLDGVKLSARNIDETESPPPPPRIVDELVAIVSENTQTAVEVTEATQTGFELSEGPEDTVTRVVPKVKVTRVFGKHHEDCSLTPRLEDAADDDSVKTERELRWEHRRQQFLINRTHQGLQ